MNGQQDTNKVAQRRNWQILQICRRIDVQCVISLVGLYFSFNLFKYRNELRTNMI